jgi:hypothetical protein
LVDRSAARSRIRAGRRRGRSRCHCPAATCEREVVRRRRRTSSTS